MDKSTSLTWIFSISKIFAAHMVCVVLTLLAEAQRGTNYTGRCRKLRKSSHLGQPDPAVRVLILNSGALPESTGTSQKHWAWANSPVPGLDDRQLIQLVVMVSANILLPDA